MEPGNSRTVFVVQVDNNKDLSDAKRYGQLRAVFGNPRKPYDAARMLYRARLVLADYQPGDHLLMVGDPALCAVCMTIVAEHCAVINVLSWDRNNFRYAAQRWDLDGPARLAPGDDDFPMADD
jgi:hypothetical protein